MKKLLGPRLGRRWFGKVGMFALDRATWRAWFEDPYLLWPRYVFALIVALALVRLVQFLTGWY